MNRELRPREVELSLEGRDTITFTEIKSLRINVPHKIGTEEGLNNNFIWPWHTGIITITLTGNSWIGAFFEPKNTDRIDTDLLQLKQALKSYTDLSTEDVSHRGTLTITDKKDDVEFYNGVIESFEFAETADQPYYISYTLVFKAEEFGELGAIRKIKDLAEDDNNDYYWSFSGEKQKQKKNENDKEQIESSNTDPAQKEVDTLTPTDTKDTMTDTQKVETNDLALNRKERKGSTA